MTVNEFQLAITQTLNEYLTKNISSSAELFLDISKSIFTDDTDSQTKITALSILFEGFYQSLAADSDLKKTLLLIRIERWKNHFGTPTITFLLSYQAEIENHRQYFSNAVSDFKSVKANALGTLFDSANNILVSQSAIADVEMPQHYEQPMQWLKTYNPAGGYTLPASDPYSQQFITDAGEAKEVVLEIGAAFGTATLEALQRGAEVYCNDIAALNLGVVQKRYSIQLDDTIKTATGDHQKLTLLPGAFPEELSGLPSGTFHAILACRVLHFFPGVKIDAAIKAMADLLKPDGKIYIICETPFQKNWAKFLPQYEKNVADDAEWPGEISDSSKFETSERRGAALPRFMHNLTKEVLERSALRTGKLEVEECSYISRQGQFTDDAIMDGRESVGLRARRIR